MRRYHLLLRAFPAAWRERYGNELFELIKEQPDRRGQSLDLLRAGLRERPRPVLSQIPAGISAGTALILLVTAGLVIRWDVSHSGGVWVPRLALTAGYVALAISLPMTVFSPLQRRLDLMFRKRTLAFLCVAVAAGCVLTAVASTAPPEPVQAPPSIAATLSPAMAATPGIVAFLSSSAPKAVEFNPSTGQTVWVGRGTVTWTATGVNYAPGGVTIAGTYQAPTYPGASQTNPWPDTSPASALSAQISH
jgi:hypothetical protein